MITKLELLLVVLVLKTHIWSDLYFQLGGLIVFVLFFLKAIYLLEALSKRPTKIPGPRSS